MRDADFRGLMLAVTATGEADGDRQEAEPVRQEVDLEAVNRPSAHRIPSYSEARFRYHATDRPPPILPPGRSWVEPNEHGG